ncbi:RNA polymerase B [Marasmius tenuissimus]|nr:RNA polymerase B [Marasmius tenuissimus]
MTTRLRHRPQTEDEDAAALKLGPGALLDYMYTVALADFFARIEFNNAGCLLISEVKYLLENRDKDAPDTAVYNKTLEYVKTFAKFNTTDSASAVRETLRREPALTQFETAQIANLCPADAEEAKSVVPSLVKIDDDRLQALLDEIQTMRKFQS